mmetsp:Transcript_66831/g.159954  ORF Transcript_66831/g.159954 Transcript_66831/m.159954 type:complete len:361 (+) Transcript_66831:87-1169(+)|eukprot:CAMPEP_0178391084 /NCGR_PEP_ID=MMETSP0689_2-20121128/10980_1 /TAXON_ID=160604 /ORGANISM="Amphidinium massartii, Strain CS-259" /LENGTH=360 /DNA_ID=CAMNT_0020011615 /DNA_START=40 /DNA_END=1122 /DNA_ORIENTATION=+
MEADRLADPEMQSSCSALSARFPQGDVRYILPWLPLSAWRAVGRACVLDLASVKPRHKDLLKRAMRQGASITSLAAEGRPALQEVAMRVWRLIGIMLDDVSTPKVAMEMFNWAHYGSGSDRGPSPPMPMPPIKVGKGKGKVRNDSRRMHLWRVRNEFPGDLAPGMIGIQATMRREMLAVETVLRVKLSINGSMSEVDKLPLIPSDTPGKLGQAYRSCTRARDLVEATPLMWATVRGTRWVKAMLDLRADPGQVTPKGWTALLYGATFESRGVVVDGASDSGEDYGGYRCRTRGVVGPLLDAGASPRATLPLEEFKNAFAPTPVTSQVVGPLDVAVGEAGQNAGWSADIRKRAGELSRVML